jgi:circadian clock protein KaiC
MHLAQMVKAVVESKPEFVIIDPISSLGFTENEVEQKCTLMILIDFLKTQGITALFTELTFADATANQSQAIISSQCDTWLVLSDLESNGEHNRGLHVLKSRGMAHSNQIREFKLTDDGIELADVYVGPGGILVGSAKVMQEARDEAARLATKLAMDKQCRELKTQIDILQSELKAKTIDLARTASEGDKVIKRDEQTRQLLRQVRHADFSPDNTGHSQRKPGPEIARPSRRGKSMATKSPARSSRQRPKRTTAAKPVKLHSVEIPTKGGSRQPSMSKKAV